MYGPSLWPLMGPAHYVRKKVEGTLKPILRPDTMNVELRMMVYGLTNGLGLPRSAMYEQQS